MLHGGDIEPAGNLLGNPDDEAITSDLKQSPSLDLVLEGFAFGFGALEYGVGMAERIGERGVRQIVKAGCGNGSVAWAMVTSVAWVRPRGVLSAPCAADYFLVSVINGEVNI